MNPIEFYTGTKEQFQSLNPPNDDGIYFITDTQEIYKGSVKYTGNTSELTKIIEATTDQVTFAKSIGSMETVIVPTKEYIDTLVGELDPIVASVHSLVEDKITYSFVVWYDGVPQTSGTIALQNFPGDKVVLSVLDEYPGTVTKWTTDDGDLNTQTTIPDATERSLEVTITDQVINYNVYVDSGGGSV